MLLDVLPNINKGIIPHAILLYGNKDAREIYALEITKTILCDSENRPCNACGSCKRFDLGTHPDFIIPQPSSKSKFIKVDDIRDIIEEINVKPFESQRRVIYIKDAGLMNVQAQNALLKSLEEPPKSAVFILGVQKKEELIDTILSRCTHIMAKSDSIQKTEKLLIENGAKPDIAHAIAFLSSSSNISALEFLKDKKKLELRKEAIMASRVLFRTGGFVEVSKKFKEQSDNIDFMVDIMETVFRDMLVFASGGKNIINLDEKNVIKNGAEYFTKAQLLEILQIINAQKQQLCYNVIKQLAVEAALLKIMEVKST